MLFNSLVFCLAFLPATLIAFYLFRGRGYSSHILIAASFIFYGFYRIEYVPILLFSIAFNWGIYQYAINSRLNGARSQANKSLLLFVSIGVNLAILGYYKYAAFFIENVNLAIGGDIGIPEIALPLAISFFTFQQISFQVEYQSASVPAPSFTTYALFVCFFPQLIAGPIVRLDEVDRQFARMGARNHRVYSNLLVGLTIAGIGLTKKVLFADQFAAYSDPVFGAAQLGEPLTFVEALFGVMAFTFQIYFDFSGYSDIALGLARMFGISLPFNFASPYKSLNVSEFWRRWHITLSRFLRDYVYIPFGGSHGSKLHTAIALVAVMVLGGLWHGAAWTFVIWGMCHGVYLVIYHCWRLLGVKLPRIVSLIVTFSAVASAWVWFRAESFDAALRVFEGLLFLNGFALPVHYENYLGPAAPALMSLGVDFKNVYYWSGPVVTGWTLVACGVVWLLPNTQQFMRRYVYDVAYDRRSNTCIQSDRATGMIAGRLAWRPTFIGLCVTVLLTVAGLVLVLTRGVGHEFIYFQF